MDKGLVSEATVADERTAPAPLSAPLRGPFLITDDFLPQTEALALRQAVDGHFSAPEKHAPVTHQVWNYWYVPQLYTYLRTSPEKVIPIPLVRSFHDALSQWARERLGMGGVTWPNLSLYVNGCSQGLHNDSANGRFGYVYSLTLDSRKSRGGETIVLRDGDLFRGRLTQAAAGNNLYDLIDPAFNRLTIFDDRMPHGVQRVEGVMDPLDGRIVLHGHISEQGAIVSGDLQPHAVWAVARPVIDHVTERIEGGARLHHGPLVLRLSIDPSGRVQECLTLVDRVARSDGGSAHILVERTIAGLASLVYPSARHPSEVTLPIMFGAALPTAKADEGILTVKTRRLVKPAVVSLVPESKPGPAVNDRVAMAVSVRERLAGRPGVARIPKPTLEAFVARDFLSDEECTGLIERIDAGRVPSGLMGAHPDPDFRTSDSCNLNPFDPLVRDVQAKIDELTGIDPRFGESIQGQRYAVGQQFKPHHDFFHTDQPYWPLEESRGGQRTWTVMAFLNVPDAGGQTMFPKAGLKVTPATGYLLIWNNLDEDGEPNHFSLHQGMPVEAGVKYVITKWYRERPWAAAVV